MHKKILLFALAAFTLVSVHPTYAQEPGKVPRIGVLLLGPPPTPSAPSPNIEAFRQGLRELGYVEGKNILIEYRYAGGKLARLPSLAAELVRLRVDVLVAQAAPAIRAAKQATNTIPIVMAVSGDPVRTGFVASLARPGGNITGLSLLATELAGKRLELLKEAIPNLSRVAVLWNSASPGMIHRSREAQAAARALGVRFQSLEVRGDPKDFEGAFSATTRERPDGLLVVLDPFTNLHRRRIAELAGMSRLPAIYESSAFAEAGGLMSYGPSVPEMYRRAAYYVDKILKGAKPADLPVEQPTKFELVINLKTAKALGITIPPEVLMRADRVIR